MMRSQVFAFLEDQIYPGFSNQLWRDQFFVLPPAHLLNSFLCICWLNYELNITLKYVAYPINWNILRFATAHVERCHCDTNIFSCFLVHVRQFEPRVVLLLPCSKCFPGTEWGIWKSRLDLGTDKQSESKTDSITFVWGGHQESVKQFVREWLRFCGAVWQDIFMCYIIKSWYSIQGFAVLLLTQKCYRFCLRPLSTKWETRENCGKERKSNEKHLWIPWIRVQICLSRWTHYVRAVPGINQNLVVCVAATFDFMSYLVERAAIDFYRSAKTANPHENEQMWNFKKVWRLLTCYLFYCLLTHLCQRPGPTKGTAQRPGNQRLYEERAGLCHICLESWGLPTCQLQPV